VALLRGPAPPGRLGPPPALQVVPGTRLGVLEAVALVVLMGIAGLGWTLWFLGGGARPVIVLSLAPTVGAAMLILAALVTTKLGFHPAEAPGVVTAVVVAVLGGIVALAGHLRAAPGRAGDGYRSETP